MSKSHYREELPPTPRREVFLAKIFGRKKIVKDSGCELTMHLFMGKLYVTRVKRVGLSTDNKQDE